ncbi:MAG: Protein p49 [Sphingomonas bacterium]|nr:Protein p49 [Sphingomonas bacterium]
MARPLHRWRLIRSLRRDTERPGYAQYGRRMIDYMGRYIENLTPDNIIGIHIDSPLDMESTSPSFRRDDLHGVAQTSYRMGSHRPTPDLGFNTVPAIDGMYRVGPFQPPRGSVFGAGRPSAMRMFDDLDLDFDRVTG